MVLSPRLARCEWPFSFAANCEQTVHFSTTVHFEGPLVFLKLLPYNRVRCKVNVPDG